jgi:cyclophilin family peptidyl-prolyl cis-trans isomerase
VPSDKRERKRANSRARAEAVAAARRRQANRRRAIVVGGAIALAIAFIALLVTQSSGGSSKVASTTSSTTPGATSTPPTTVSLAVSKGAAITGDTPCPKADGSSPRTTSFAKAPPTCITTGKKYTATMTTDAGVITIALDPTAAPITVNNFVVLARYHYFDGIAFHRVIPDFVDQGGDPTGTGTGGPGYQFKDELPAAGAYKVGSLAMANSGADTNGSQFFLIAGSQGVALPAKYSLFGMATGGVDVITKINKDGDPSGTPKVVHKITSVTIAEA